MTLTREQIATYRAAQPALDEAMAQLRAEATAEAANWPDKGRHETWAAISLAEYDVIAAAIAAHDALLDIAEAVDGQCEWTYDDDSYSWDTSCGAKWCFTDDGPVENGVKFCHCCGKRVALVVLPLAGEA
jgi:hypothetical protein